MTVGVARTEATLAALLPLVRAHIAFERSGATLPRNWAARIARHVADGRVTVLVADDDGAVGFAAVTRDVAVWTATHYAHLDCLFVDGAARGRGHGARLLEAAAESARAQGLRELQWQTPAWNADAIRFYERHGAVSVEKRRFALAL